MSPLFIPPPVERCVRCGAILPHDGSQTGVLCGTCQTAIRVGIFHKLFFEMPAIASAGPRRTVFVKLPRGDVRRN